VFYVKLSLNKTTLTSSSIVSFVSVFLGWRGGEARRGVRTFMGEIHICEGLQ